MAIRGCSTSGRAVRWKADGSYGKGTAQAVSDFQRASGLPEDGVASLKTLYTLFAA